MRCKNFDETASFADYLVEPSRERNQSRTVLTKIDGVVNWSRIEAILAEGCRIGAKKEGAAAYPPLLLLKALLLQKWFRVLSDPELEAQINDRISFKLFLGLPLDRPAPNHSTFSRCRKRLSRRVMEFVNSDLLRQFAAQGLTIAEGIAVDARLIHSASRPRSAKKLREERAARATPEGKLDRNGGPLKFSRDMESDWTVTNDVPHCGLKEHASVDVKHGFVLSATITPASHGDSPYLPYCAAASLHTETPLEKVYADKGCFGEPNRDFLHRNGIADGVMRNDATTAKLTDHEKQRNRKTAKKSCIVEQYFGLTHLHQGACRARFVAIAGNLWDALARQLACNVFRGMKLIRCRG